MKRSESFHLPDGVDYIFDMWRWRYVKVTVQMVNWLPVRVRKHKQPVVNDRLKKQELKIDFFVEFVPPVVTKTIMPATWEQEAGDKSEP